MSTYRRTAAAVPWAFAESLFNAVNGVASTIVVGYFLSPKAVGQAGAALAVIVLIEIGCAFGLGEAIVRGRSGHSSVTDSAYTGLLLFSLIGTGLCCALAWPLADLFGDEQIGWLLLVGSVLPPLAALGVVPVAILTRKMRADVLVKRGMITKAATLIVSGGLAYAGWGAWSIMVSTIVGSALAGVTLLGTVTRWPKLRLNRSELRELMKFGGLISVEMLLTTGTTRLFSLLFGIFHGVDALGYLQFAQRLLDEMANLVQNVALRFGLSFFASMERRGQNTVGGFAIGTEVAVILAAPLLIGFALVFPDALWAVNETRWLPSYIFVGVAALSWTLLFPTVLVSPLLRARGVQKPLVLYSLFSCVVTIAGCILTAGASANLAAVAWGSRHYFAIPAGLWMMARFTGLSWSRYMVTFARPFASTAIMAAAVLVLRAQDLSPMRRLWLEIGVGVVVYVAMTAVLEMPLLRRVRMMRLAGRPTV